ncbi:hypothetical protein SCALM49S_01371 [Streptomyces californicus]
MERAAPAIRASCLKVLEVATTWSGRPERLNSPTVRAMLARTCRRNALTCSGCAGSSGSQAPVRRPAPSGRETAVSGSSSMPTAISREPPPMSRTSSFPADQPNQRRAARKVSRASSSPLRTARSTPVSIRTRSSTSSALVASRTAEVANGRTSSHPLVLGRPERLDDRRHQPVHAERADRTGFVEEFGEPQLGLVRVRGQRAGAGVGVDHQQVNRVRTDVEDSESHTGTLLRRGAPSVRRSDLRWARAKDEKG